MGQTPASMRCLGAVASTRICYFTDVYFHISSNRWHFYGHTTDEAGFYSVEDTQSLSTWIQMSAYALQ